VDYRLAESPQDKEAIYRLRYDAYLREQALRPDSSCQLSDAFDDLDNTWVFGIHIDGALAASVRLHVSTDGRVDFPAAQIFPETVLPELQAGKRIVDPTRFVADATASRLYPELPYVTLRAAFLAAEHFNADLVLATVRAEHQAFYKRVFGHKPIAPPRPYLTLLKPLSMMMLNFPPAREQILSRYPFFHSTQFERRKLFERLAVPSHAPAAEISAA
jgi:hypothetical protein